MIFQARKLRWVRGFHAFNCMQVSYLDSDDHPSKPFSQCFAMNLSIFNGIPTITVARLPWAWIKKMIVLLESEVTYICSLVEPQYFDVYPRVTSTDWAWGRILQGIQESLKWNRKSIRALHAMLLLPSDCQHLQWSNKSYQLIKYIWLLDHKFW